MPFILGGSLAGLGLIKDLAIDQPAANRQRKLAAVKEANSWITGQHPGDVKDPNYAGDILGGATSGAMLGQGLDRSKADSVTQGKFNSWLDSQSAAKNAATAGLSDTSGLTSSQVASPALEENPNQNATEVMGRYDAGQAADGYGAPQPGAAGYAPKGAPVGFPGQDPRAMSPWMRSQNPAAKVGQYPI